MVKFSRILYEYAMISVYQVKRMLDTTKIGFGFLLLCIVATSAPACNRGSSETSPSQIATAQRGDLRIEVTASGNLIMSMTADLAFDVEGTIEKVLVEEGDSITEGQILAELEKSGSEVNYRPTTSAGTKSTRSRSVVPWENQKRNLERALIQAKAALNTAIRDLKNAKSPQSTDAAPDPLNIETNEHKVRLAELALSNAQAELERFLLTSPEIKAPFNGFVTKLYVNGGDVISKGTVAISVASKDKFETAILVSEMDIRRIQVGMPATVQVAAVNGALFPAKVTEISPTATVQSGVVNYQVVVQLLLLQDTMSPRSGQNQPGVNAGNLQTISDQKLSDNIPMAQLRDGFTATTRILIEEKKNVVLVPNRTIIRDGAKTSVQVINNGTTELRLVTIGSSNGQITEVMKGLDEGEQVLIQQLQKR